MAEVERYDWKPVRMRALEEAAVGTGYLLVPVDKDVLNPADAPVTGPAEPNVLTLRKLSPLLRRLGAEYNLVGIELVELNPSVHRSYITTLVANRATCDRQRGCANSQEIG